MLARLSIRNFAIISELETRLKPGLNIISGETGAGKSILVNAVNLLLGGRGSSDLIRTGKEEARVSALFHVPVSSPVDGILKELDIPLEGEVLITRTISREGRNTARINGSLATVRMLSRITPCLISLSGQHEHQQLLRPDQHLKILDTFGGLEKEREQTQERFYACQDLQGRASRLGEKIQMLEEKRDLDRYQMEEILSAHIEPHEDDLLQEERKRLRHAGELRESVGEAYNAVYERDNSLLSEVARLEKRLEKASQVDVRLESIQGILSSIRAELEEAALQLREIQGDIPMDPFRLEQVEERLQVLIRLKRKHGPTLEDVLQTGERLSRQMDNMEGMKQEHKSLLTKLETRKKALFELALDLSQKRKQAAERLASAVEGELELLAMGNARFEVDFEPRTPKGDEDPESILDHVGPTGLDRVSFLISPNPGEELRPLARIASGGELSRIMLALKTILAGKASVDTVVFDEVDAGIGGATAETVGEKLLALARFHQILCITHLPQIAGKGEVHFVVRKGVRDNRTEAEIAELDADGRVEEMARLLGGKDITPTALEHAREMLRRD